MKGEHQTKGEFKMMKFKTRKPREFDSGHLAVMEDRHVTNSALGFFWVGDNESMADVLEVANIGSPSLVISAVCYAPCCSVEGLWNSLTRVSLGLCGGRYTRFRWFHRHEHSVAAIHAINEIARGAKEAEIQDSQSGLEIDLADVAA